MNLARKAVGTALRLPPPRARTRCRFLFCVLLATSSAVACSKTPPEPAPAATTSVVAAPAVRSAPPPSRCVTPLAKEPPRIPPAALDRCPADPDPVEKLPTVEVSFPEAPGAPKVVAELVQGERQVQKGLMYRRSMAEDRGMLFRFAGERRVHSFWMHNTCIPLDMVFVDEDGLIVGIVEAAEPLTDTTRDVGCPSTWVLELVAGYARKHGVSPGQRMALPAGIR